MEKPTQTTILAPITFAGDLTEQAAIEAFEQEVMEEKPEYKGVSTKGISWPWGDKIHQGTEHILGYVDAEGKFSDALKLPPNPDLKGQKLLLRLDRLFAHEYPGGGTFDAVFSCSVDHFVENTSNPATFTQSYVVRNGQAAGVSGWPMFTNLVPGGVGLGLKIGVVVSSQREQEIVDFLDSDPYKKGIDLAGTFNPAVKMVCQFSEDIFKFFANRNKNRGVHKLDLGLGFSKSEVSPPLTTGSYVIIQAPRSKFKFQDYFFDKDNHTVMYEDANGQRHELPYNYLVISVEKA